MDTLVFGIVLCIAWVLYIMFKSKEGFKDLLFDSSSKLPFEKLQEMVKNELVYIQKDYPVCLNEECIEKLKLKSIPSFEFEEYTYLQNILQDFLINNNSTPIEIIEFLSIFKSESIKDLFQIKIHVIHEKSNMTIILSVFIHNNKVVQYNTFEKPISTFKPLPYENSSNVQTISNDLFLLGPF